MKLICFMLISFFSCTAEKAHLRQASLIQSQFNKSMKDQNFVSYGMGGGLFKDIEEFTFEYELRVDSININKARKDIIINTEKILEITNNKDAIPYLRHCPFNEKYLFFGITYTDRFKNYFGNNQITRVAISYGEVVYSADDGKKYIDLMREPYAEAYEKVYGVPLPDRKKQFGVE